MLLETYVPSRAGLKEIDMYDMFVIKDPKELIGRRKG